MEGKDSAMGIPPPTGSGSNNSSSSNSTSSGSGATMMATSPPPPPPPTGGVTVSLYQHGASSAMTASAPTTTSTPTPTATVTVAATPAAAPAPTQNQAAVPVAVAVPTTVSVQAATVPSVMTAAAQMPTVVTAAAALGPRSVTIASSDEKPITNTTNNTNVNSTTANANNSNSSSSNNNNNNSSSFPTCNPTPISAAAGPNTLIHGSQGQGIMGMNMGMNRPMPMGMGMGMNMGMGSGTPDSLKRKRGRPRKYGPDGSMALALAPLSSQPGPFSPLQKRGRGRPPGSGRKQRLAALGEWVLGSAGIGFTPHVITIAAGEDVASKIMSFSQQGPRAVCILSANGAISNVTLRQPATSGGTLTYEGRFEILSLSGSFLLTESGGTRSRTGGLSVSLASPDGRVIGGGVAGMLMAATPVQVVVGSFISNGQKDFTRPSNPEPSIGMQQVPGSGPPTNAIPISRASLNDTYGGPGSPSLNQNTAGSYNTNISQPQVHNMPSFQSMSWTGSQSMREARHNTDINISLPGG